MSRPVWLTFSRSKTLISSVANGFKCFAFAKGMIVRAVNAEAPWLDGAVWNEVLGDVEMSTFGAAFILLVDSTVRLLFSLVL